MEFLQGKGIRIKNQEVPEGGVRGVALESADLPSDDDEDDDDYDAPSDSGLSLSLSLYAKERREQAMLTD